jgi:hypothetical protein
MCVAIPTLSSFLRSGIAHTTCTYKVYAKIIKREEQSANSNAGL